ncbi:hypothetical protein AUL38_01455 [Leucobacter sp. G161]|nr:hypothetical protein AUL38_01455 [Leucobacter sp. G161]
MGAKKSGIGRALPRWLGMTVAAAIAVAALIAPAPNALETPAQAAPVAAPEVTFFHGYNAKIDDLIDELRLSLVLKVPRGYVDEQTLELKPVDGKYLRVGYDHYGGESSGTLGYLDNRYINTSGAAGALSWAKNVDQYFTIHKVIPAGDNDFLVMSIEGDMNFRDNLTVNNVVDGRRTTGPVFFSFERGAPGSGAAWMRGAPLTTYNVEYNIYSARSGAVSGPIVQVLWDNQYSLWSRGQANWAMVLDYDLALGNSAGINRPGSVPEGVVPANSVGVHLVNPAFNTAARGPANSVTKSFWYAWVHEDGRLVKEINTGPIRVDGMTPNSNVWPAGSTGARMAKNEDTGGSRPTLAYTDDAGAQGLNGGRVSRSGEIDFRGLQDRGTGYYRLLAWPETSNPTSVTTAAAGKERVFAAGDLFDGAGRMTALAEDQKWTAGSAYYKYTIDRPTAPLIELPADGSYTTVNNEVVISGTGEPGRSISLKFRQGDKITNTSDPALLTIVDGDRNCVASGGCEVVVDSSGKWSYTYKPRTPLADGRYTVVALQTEQDSRFNLTSDPSNPNNAAQPTAWGVSFTVDTVVPNAPVLTCPVSPTQDTQPTLRGSGVEPGAVVTVHQRNLSTEPPTDTSHTASVSGPIWEYTPDAELPNGKYQFWATQQDSAGNTSPASSPKCEVQVSTSVPTLGEKVVQDVRYPAPELAPVGAENWEITATEGTTTEVISDPSQPIELDRDKTYVIGERLRAMPEPSADAYTLQGKPECLDGNGVNLPVGMFNPTTSQLTVSATADVTAPITCSLTNQASQVSYVTQRLGGQTAVAPAGWKLSGTSTEGDSFSLLPEEQSVVAKPASFELSAALPTGLALVGIQKLDLASAGCAPHAVSPLSAPQSCWIETEPSGTLVAQGTHEVFRLVAGAPVDMPTLPLTGGLGSWQFLGAGGIALALAALGQWRRRHLMNARRRTATA